MGESFKSQSNDITKKGEEKKNEKIEFINSVNDGNRMYRYKIHIYVYIYIYLGGI